jgi:hypothetical protein
MSVVIAKLRNLAPYAALELVMPGGSVMAILLWLYRRRKQQRRCPGHWALNTNGPAPSESIRQRRRTTTQSSAP